MSPDELVPSPGLDLGRLRKRIVWMPTATLAALIALYGVLEFVGGEVTSVYTVAEHILLLLFVSGGGLVFSNHTFNIIRRSHEEIHRQRSVLTRVERRSLALLEKSSDLVVLLDVDGVVKYVGPALTRTLGYSPEAWTGTDVLAFVHADERENIRERLRAVRRESNAAHTDTFRVRHQDGSWRWIAAVWTDLLGDPHVEAIVCNARDISERKHAEDLLAWRAHLNSTIAELHRSLASVSVPIPEINELILRCARELTGSAHGFLSYIDPLLGDNVVSPATEMLSVAPGGASARGPGATVIPRQSTGRYPGLRGFALNTGEPFFTNAPTTHPTQPELPSGHVSLVRFLAVPVNVDGKLAGEIAVANSTRDYTEHDLESVVRVAECYALAIQRRRAEEEVAAVAKFPSENPHPIMRLSQDGTILYANAASARLLKMWDGAEGRCAPVPWRDMVHDALATGGIRSADVECGDVAYAFSVVPVQDAGYVNLYGRDITDRRRAEEALRKANDALEKRVAERTEELYTANCWLEKEIAERRRADAELRAWFDNVPIGLYRTTRAGRILDANPALVQLLGFPDKGTLLATNTTALYTNHEDRKRWVALVEREEVLTGFEAQVRRHDGKLIWVRNSARAIRDWEGRVVYYEGGLEDITALKQSEDEILASREQLRVLSAHLESIREEERTRLAREIHDELGQLLTGLKLDLAWIAAKLSMSQELMREKLRAMSVLVDDTIKSVRRIATELRPGILDDLGLMAAVEWQTQEFQARTGIHCEFVASVKRVVEDQEQRTAMFRILQEALTNVARHAHATKVVISLREEDHCFELCVEDNGRGITEAEIRNRQSLGLLGIQERARLLGGEVGIAGRPGTGTTISVRIPVDHRPAPPPSTPHAGLPLT